MKKLILLFLLIILLMLGCSKFDNLGMPSWNVEYQVNFLNDSYDVNNVAEFDSSLYVQDNELYFHTDISDSIYFDDVHIEYPEEKFVSVNLGDLYPDLEPLNGQTLDNVPPFNLVTLQRDIPDYNEFQEITFETARLKYTFENNTDVYIGDYPSNPITISLFDRDANENVFQYVVEGNIAPHDSLSTIIDLSGYTFPNTLRMQIEGGSRGSGGEPVTVDVSQELVIGLEILDIKISHVIAQIPYQELPETHVIQNLDISFPHIDGNFALNSNSEIKFKINSILPSYSLVKLVAIGENNNTDTLKVNGEFPYIQASVGESDTTFYSYNSNLNDLLSILPEKFVLYLTSSVGDSSNTLYEINNTDMVSYDIGITTNANIDADCWLIPKSGDVPNVSVSNVEDFDINKYNSFNNGGLKLFFDNKTGIQLGMDLLLSNDRNSFSEFSDVLQPDTSRVTIFSIPVITANKDSVDILIQKSDLNVLLGDSLYVVPRVRLISSGNEPFANGIDIKGKLHINILLNKDIMN